MTLAESMSPVVSLLPDLQSCIAIALGTGDVLVHAPGFEDRTMASAGLLQDSPGAMGLLLDYRPAYPTNRLKAVRSAFAARSLTVSDADVLVYDRFRPDNFQSRLAKRLQECQAKRVVVDVSTMSKLAIMLVLDVCLALKLDVRVFYAEAEEYGPSREEFEKAKAANQIHQPSLQVFTGVHGVVRVDSLKSVAMQGSPTAALVFMSLNDALTQVLLNTVYPSRLFLINGRPPLHSWREEATAWIHDQVRREWEEDNPTMSLPDSARPQRTISTLDYRETVGLLLQLYWQLSSRHRVLLAPAGSKMQAIGCFLVKALHPDIHVEYPSPEGFLPEYSHRIGDRWMLEFGDLADLVARVADLEKREYLEIHPYAG